MSNSNKYGSLRNSFIGSDLYNLVIPVTPPADLSIASSLMAPSFLNFRLGATTKVVGFSPREKPYIRGMGLSSNLADGLVDASASHYGGGSNWEIQLQLQRFGAALTGTIANTAGSANIVGTGTLFTRELAVGSIITWLDANQVVRSGTVATITTDTALVLTAVTKNTALSMFLGNTVTGVAYPMLGNAGASVIIPILMLNVTAPFDFFLGDVSLIYPPLGRISVASGSAAVTGVGTSFQTDFVAGSVIGWLDVSGVRRTGVVASIASQTALTLTAVTYAQASGAAMIDLDNHLRIQSQMSGVNFLAYTITIDPAFATRRMSLSALAEVEHSFPMTVAVS